MRQATVVLPVPGLLVNDKGPARRALPLAPALSRKGVGLYAGARGLNAPTRVAKPGALREGSLEHLPDWRAIASAAASWFTGEG